MRSLSEVLFIAEYDVFRYIRTLHEVRPSSAFMVWGVSRILEELVYE
jgi:hypothetical protein